MLVQFSKSISIFLMVAVSVPAMASTQCKYINEYQHDSDYGDERVQSYLNFYAKMGAGGPVRIKIPGCISKKSDEAIRKEILEEAIKNKNNKNEAQEADVNASVAKNVEYKTANFSAGSDRYVVDQQVLADRKTKEFKKETLSYLKGTSTFCKAIVICERDDGTSYLNDVFCRGSSTDECPSADDCLKDQNVAMNANGLWIENKNQPGVKQGLDGEQKPSTVQGR